MPDQSPAFPDAVSWTFRNARTKEQRTYEQTELSLEGEARILGIGHGLIAEMNERAVPWARVRAMFDDDAVLDWGLLVNVVGVAVEVAPQTVAEAVATFLGLFPFDEAGQRNPDYEGEVTFLRRALNISRVVEVAKVAVAQNDYKRMLAPFSGALTSAARLGMETMSAKTTPPASTASVEPSPSSPEPVSVSRATSSGRTRTAKS